MSDGSLGKIKAISELIKLGYDVFIEIDGKSPFDLVAHKNNKLLRIEVKSTNARNPSNTGWIVQLKKVRSNKNVNTIYNFSKDQCDILAIYIEKTDKIIFINSDQILAKSALVINDNYVEGAIHGDNQT